MNRYKLLSPHSAFNDNSLLITDNIVDQLIMPEDHRKG
jgi:hypothetical protein